MGRVAIFSPNPLLTVTAEARPSGGDDVHLHPGGQGVWVARMAGELGAHAVLCGFAGGETGAVLRGLLAALPGERRLVETAGPSGCVVFDRRTGRREVVAAGWTAPPGRHEVDELFSVTCAAALESDVLVVCNPYPPESVPVGLYADLVADVRANGTPVLVDLSTPRLETALEGAPELLKLNDWELAELLRAPVYPQARLLAAARELRERGAGAVLVTRAGEPALFLDSDEPLELVPPRFERGAREGCGDSMAGGIAAGLAAGLAMRDAVVLGAAAGAANFQRHGLGTGSAAVVESLRERVALRPLDLRADWSEALTERFAADDRAGGQAGDPVELLGGPPQGAQPSQTVR
jgi:1-phosphofructokinase